MFKGTYYRHQANGNTLCVIEGKAAGGRFLQIIINNEVYHYDDFSGCVFSKNGISLYLPNIKGQIFYSDLTLLKSDIMGVFRFFPMQCRHKIVSMHHHLSGGISVDGKFIDFSGGTGYIEGDSGRSFPKSYLWIHCNDFADKCGITASVADIPFLGFSFRGCICAIIYKNKEYRLATYKGVKIEEASQNKLVLTQKKLKLEIDMDGQNFLPLKMPVNGRMNATTFESNSAAARFRFYENNTPVFDLFSENAGFEYYNFSEENSEQCQIQKHQTN